MAHQVVHMLLDNPLVSDARVEKEASTLVAAGYKLIIHAVEKDGWPEKEVKNGYTIIRDIQLSIDHPFSKAYKVFRKNFVDKMVAESFDILHCHDFKMIILGALIKRKRPNLKLVYDAHEFLPGWPLYEELKGWQNRLKGLLVWKRFVRHERRAIRACDAIITVGPALALEMKKEYGLKQEPAVLRNIPEKIDLDVTPQYFHRHFNLPANTVVLIHSGNLYHSDERIQMMINAVLQVEKCVLVFIGNSQKLKTLAENNTSPRILFHDYVERERLYNLMGAADFGIVHTWQPDWRSHWFSLPNRIMEYTCAGLPIISTSQPEFMKLGLAYGNMVFYRGHNEGEMVQAISNGLLMRDALKRNAFNAAKALSWESESKVLLDLYAQL